MSNDIENNSVFLLLYHSPFYYKTINNLAVDYQVTNLQELPLKEIQKPKSKIDLCIEYTCHLLWINYCQLVLVMIFFFFFFFGKGVLVMI